MIYIDDLIYIGLPSEIHKAYQYLMDLLHKLGLEISTKKLVPSSICVTCMGIQIDTVSRKKYIYNKSIRKLVNCVTLGPPSGTAAKNPLPQSLLGSLLYITKCVMPARFFLTRMLALLRANHLKYKKYY